MAAVPGLCCWHRVHVGSPPPESVLTAGCPGLGTQGPWWSYRGQGLSVLESGGLEPACLSTKPERPSTLVPTVLQGLIEGGSPHLEELLAALFATAPASPTLRPVAVVSSLLLQEKEPPAPGDPEADGCR